MNAISPMLTELLQKKSLIKYLLFQSASLSHYVSSKYPIYNEGLHYEGLSTHHPAQTSFVILGVWEPHWVGLKTRMKKKVNWVDSVSAFFVLINLIFKYGKKSQAVTWNCKLKPNLCSEVLWRATCQCRRPCWMLRSSVTPSGQVQEVHPNAGKS